MTPFQSLREYEEYIYTLRKQFSSIQQSTLVLIPRGRRITILQEDLLFDHGFRLSIRERLSDELGQVMIEAYGYEIWRNSEKIAWYDAQPHPENAELQSTYPHHKHISPDIKHHRVPAPGISFEQPNFPHLIDEIKSMLDSTTR